MKLGMLVNTAKHADDVIGICRAALAAKHEVIIFAMDEGTRLLENAAFVSLAELDGVSMSLCDHSAKMLGAKTEGLSPKIACASQLSNAMMNHNADRVIVL
ncbi:MAG: DsrE family protein [Pseudomonadota bacterium]